jgi:hypothetical protein
MNSFDEFFWVLAAFLVTRLIRTGDARLWLWFGLVIGVGVENKYSIGFFAAGLVAAMTLTPLRKHFLKWPLWLGGLIAVVLVLPHVVWQMKNGWPTLEFMHNAASFKNMPTTPLQYFSGQVLLAGPLNTPLWLAGLLYGLLSKRGRTFVVFSLAYVFLFVVFNLTNGKVYYLTPIYPILFALGSLWLERITASRRWAKITAASLAAIAGIVLAPLAIPVFTPPTFLRFQQTLGIHAPQQERAHGGRLPQHLGDRLGWEEFVAMVGQAYAKLDPADRAKCAIFVSNYGEAGAINLLGRRYGLPRAISGYMSYYFWGPGDATGEVMLVYWDNKSELEKLFVQVTEVARFHHPYVMERQNDRPLFLCRRLKIPIAEAWKQVKAFQ